VGAEGAGVVCDRGSDVLDLEVGTPVAIFPGGICGDCEKCMSGRENLCERSTGVLGFHIDGVAADYVAVPRRMVVPVPRDVDLKYAACAPITFATVVHMLFKNAKLDGRDAILVHAAGSGIGSTAIKISKHLGCTVFTTIGDEAKREFAESLGADHIINYNEVSFESVVRNLTGSRGVDVVFEHTGARTWMGSIRSMAPGGRLVTCGATSGPSARMNLMLLFNKQLRIFGSFGGDVSDVVHGLRLMMESHITPSIENIWPIERYGDAIERMASRKVVGKSLLELSDD
jgi:NADPH:quinone reductase-like Zn-dependent oxidoreductase